MGPTEYKVQEIERVVNKIDGKLDKLDDRMDKLENSYARMEVTLEVNTASLQEHMKRSDLLEKQINLVDRKVSEAETGLKTVVKVGVLLSVLVSAAWSVFTFIFGK